MSRSLGLILLGLNSPVGGSGYSTDVSSWTSRTRAAGGSLDPTTLSIVDSYFVKPLIRAGLRTKFKLCYFFCGSGVNTHRVPLFGSTLATFNSLVDGDCTASGLSGNSSTKFINFNVKPSDLGVTNDDVSLLVYGTNLTTGSPATLLSAHDGTRQHHLFAQSSTEHRSRFGLDARSHALRSGSYSNGWLASQTSGRYYQQIFGASGLLAGFDRTVDILSASTPTPDAPYLALAFDSTGLQNWLQHSGATLRFAAITSSLSNIEMKLVATLVEQVNARLLRPAASEPVKYLDILWPSSYQIFQRNSSDRATISIVGYYGGSSATTIQARWNGGSWTSIATVTAPGRFSGNLTNQLAGQGTLEVRTTTQPGDAISRNFVGIGDIYWIIGSSNAEGQFTNAQAYSHGSLKASLLRKNGDWVEYAEPSGSGHNLNSVWGPLATSIMADQSVPVGFITGARSDTDLLTNWHPTNGAYYKQAVQAVKQAGVTAIKGVLAYIGELDAVNGASQTNIKNALDQLILALQTDASFSGVKMIAAQIGSGTGASASNINAVRYAVAQCWDTNSNTPWGFPTWNVDLTSDAGKWVTNAHATTLKNRWWRAIKYHFYSGTEDRALYFSSATASGSTITLNLAGGAGSIVLGASPEAGWIVTDGNGTRTVSSVTSGGVRALTITCDQPLINPVQLTLASGDSISNTIQDSGSIAAYPIEPFSQPVTVTASQDALDFTDSANSQYLPLLLMLMDDL